MEETKMRIISNPYRNEIIYEKYDASEEKWERITEESSGLRSKQYQTGMFSDIVEKAVSIIIREYRNEGENISFTFEGTQDEYEQLKSVIEKNREFMYLNPLRRYLDNVNDVLLEMENIQNSIKPIILEGFTPSVEMDGGMENSAGVSASYDKCRKFCDYLQEVINEASNRLQKAESGLIKKKNDFEEELKKGEAALDEEGTILLKKLQDKCNRIVEGACSNYEDWIERKKESKGSEISKSFLEEKENAFIKLRTDEVLQMGLKPEKNQKEINDKASKDLLKEANELYTQRLKKVKRELEINSVNFLEDEMIAMRSKLEAVIKDLSVLDANSSSELLQVVSNFRAFQFDELIDALNLLVDGINVAVDDIYVKPDDVLRKVHLEKVSLLNRINEINWLKKKTLNPEKILEVLEDEFAQKKDSICKEIIEKNVGSFKEWANNLYQELNNTLIRHQSPLAKEIEEAERVRNELKIQHSQLEKYGNEIHEKMEWKKIEEN